MNPAQIKGLALEGGGVCGIGHVGVAKYLAQIGIYNLINYFIGSSAGSMIAVLLACRVSADELEDIMLKFNFNDLRSNSWLFIGSIYRLNSEWGLNPGQNIATEFSKVLDSVTGIPNITFKQLNQKYGTHCIITATSYRYQKTIYYSDLEEWSENRSVIEAIRASASYPFEFSPMLTTTLVNGKEEPDYHMDGGILDNYPIERLYNYLKKEEVIGVKLVSKAFDKELKKMPNSILEFGEAIGAMIRNQAFKTHFNKDDAERTISVNVGLISCMDFNLEIGQKMDLVGAGWEAAKNFFNP